MIFIITLKPALKEENLYYKSKKKPFITNEKNSTIKNLYKIEKLIDKSIVYFRNRKTRRKKTRRLISHKMKKLRINILRII